MPTFNRSLCEKVKECFINLFTKQKNIMNKNNSSDQNQNVYRFDNDILNDGDGPVWF